MSVDITFVSHFIDLYEFLYNTSSINESDLEGSLRDNIGDIIDDDVSRFPNVDFIRFIRTFSFKHIHVRIVLIHIISILIIIIIWLHRYTIPSFKIPIVIAVAIIIIDIMY